MSMSDGMSTSDSAVQADFERRLGEASMVAILRGLTPDATTALALELRSIGVQHIEVTMQDDQGLAALRQTIQEWPDGPDTVGAGSVVSVASAQQAVEAGASFLISPGLSAAVVEFARAHAVAVLPGVATPSEVQEAMALGLSAVKLFPAAQLGGTAYLRALAGPFPGMRFVPTGGVDFDNADDYLAQGALAVGIGGQLTQPAGIDALRSWIDARAN